MKKFFVMLAIWFVVIVSVIVGSIVYDQVKTSDYDTAASVYLEKVIPQISRWDVETTRSLMAPEALANIKEGQLEQLIQFFQKMGTLKGMEEPRFSQIHSEDPEKGAIVEYKIDVLYENGEGQMVISLLIKDNQFSVYHFSLSSKALTE